MFKKGDSEAKMAMFLKEVEAKTNVNKIDSVESIQTKSNQSTSENTSVFELQQRVNELEAKLNSVVKLFKKNLQIPQDEINAILNPQKEQKKEKTPETITQPEAEKCPTCSRTKSLKTNTCIYCGK